MVASQATDSAQKDQHSILVFVSPLCFTIVQSLTKCGIFALPTRIPCSEFAVRRLFVNENFFK